MAKGKGFIVLIALLAVALGGGYVYYINSPLYAVKKAADAVKAHDVQQFHQFVDVRSVAKASMDDLVAEPIRKSGAGILERVIGATVVSFFEPASAQAMESQIDRWVEHHGGSPATASHDGGNDAAATSNGGDDDDDTADQPKSFVGQLVAMVRPPSLKQLFKEYGFTKKNFKGFHQEQGDANVSHVVLDFNSPKTGGVISVDLELHKDTGHWVVTRVANLQDIVAKITAP